jgi:molecular chaperone DnaK
LHVSAKDLGTGKEQKITITASNNLSKEEVEKMTREAKEHEAEDKQKRDIIDTKNNADSVVYQTENILKEMGAKIAPDVKKKIEDKLSELKEVKNSEDASKIKEKLEELNKVVQEMSTKLYQQAQGAQDGSEDVTGKNKKSGKSDENIVDGEVVDEAKKEENKKEEKK